MNFSNHDLNLILSVIDNKINDIEHYDKDSKEFKYYYDYKFLYSKIRKELLKRIQNREGWFYFG